jgi:hypothetical protein
MVNVIEFLEEQGIRWQPVFVDTSGDRKRPLRFTDGLKPDPHEMRRMTHFTEADEGKPVATDGELRRRQAAYLGVETNCIWIDTSQINVVDIDTTVDRHIAHGYPQTKSMTKGLPHAFVKRTDGPSNKTRRPIGDGSELLCGQPVLQFFSDVVYNPDSPWEASFNINDAEGSDYAPYMRDLNPYYLRRYKPLANIAAACKNLCIAKESLEAIMPDISPYSLESAWRVEPHKQGLGTLKLYGKTKYAQHERDFETWRNQFELYFFFITELAVVGYENDKGELWQYSPATVKSMFGYWGEKFVKLWLSGQVTRLYSNVNFVPPPLRCEEDTYNRWHGFWWQAHMPLPHYTNGDGGVHDIEIFERFLMLLAGGDTQESLGLLRGFLGQMLVEPGNIPHKVPIIYSSKQGVGKSTFLEHIMSAVIGKDYHASASFSEVFNSFNNQVAGKLLCLIDEAVNTQTEKWRYWIANQATQGQVRQEEKYQRPYWVYNTCRLVMATNDSGLMSMSSADRRYVVFQCARTPTNDEIQQLRYAGHDQEKLKAFAAYLMDHWWHAPDISMASGPDNDARKAMRAMTKGKDIARWLEHEYETASPAPKRIMQKSEVMQKMKDWAREQPDAQTLSRRFEITAECKKRIEAMIADWGDMIRRYDGGNNNFKGSICFNWSEIKRVLRDE